MLASVVVDQNMLLPGSVGLTDYSPPGPARLFQFGSGTRTSKVSDLEYLTRKQVK
jgi:hypothetical protein